MNTKALGVINEEQCKLYWMELGYNVSTPTGITRHMILY